MLKLRWQITQNKHHVHTSWTVTASSPPLLRAKRKSRRQSCLCYKTHEVLKIPWGINTLQTVAKVLEQQHRIRSFRTEITYSTMQKHQLSFAAAWKNLMEMGKKKKLGSCMQTHLPKELNKSPGQAHFSLRCERQEVQPGQKEGQEPPLSHGPAGYPLGQPNTLSFLKKTHVSVF